MPQKKIQTVHSCPSTLFDEQNIDFQIIKMPVHLGRGNTEFRWKLTYDNRKGKVVEFSIEYCPFCGKDLNGAERTKNEKDYCLMH